MSETSKGLIDLFSAKYQEKRRSKYDFTKGTDNGIASRLFKKHGYHEVANKIVLFFDYPNDWLKRNKCFNWLMFQKMYNNISDEDRYE